MRPSSARYWLAAAAVVLAGAAPPADAAPPTGTIMVHGGGAPGMAYIRNFARRCGEGAHLVVIPTATIARANAPRQKIHDKWTKRGFGKVSVVHTHDRSRAEDPSFSRALQSADCVWISGGAQRRLEAAYDGTPVVDGLRSVLARGGVVSGYSAGASILADVIIRRGKIKPESGRGFGLLPGLIIDQHFIALERQGRMDIMLARHPDLVGYGLDERTGLVITGSHYEVVGSSVVLECHHGDACRTLRAGDTGELATH
ncbi:MAG: cyanophycinase [Myxococcota bacterium]